MARQLRIEFPNALYHVTSRGNRRSAIYRDDRDRDAFLRLLRDVVGRFGWLCHAYCLMGNHYHLMVETPQPNLSRGMRQLNGVYTQRYNFRHGKSGHVFQGRFKAVLIEKEGHLLEVSRYVVLNPVRARMVDTPRQWRWSSYRATAGFGAPPPWLTTDWVLAQFGRRKKEAQREFRSFVREGARENSPWEGLIGGFLLGSEEFVAECRSRLSKDKDLSEMPQARALEERPSLEDLFADMPTGDKSTRNTRIAAAYLQHEYTMKAIADYLGIHYMTASRAVAALESRM